MTRLDSLHGTDRTELDGDLVEGVRIISATGGDAPLGDDVPSEVDELDAAPPPPPPAWPPPAVRIGFDDALDEVGAVTLSVPSREVELAAHPPVVQPSDGSPTGRLRIGDEDEAAAVAPDGSRAHPRVRARRIGVQRAVGRRRLRLVVAVATLAALVAGAVAVLRSPYLSVRDLQLDGAAYVDRERLAGVLGEVHGDPLVSLDLDRIRDELQADPWVERVSVQRRWPDGLRVEIAERVPVATFIGQDQGWRVVDSDGHVIAVLEPGHKPLDLILVVDPEGAPDVAASAQAPERLAAAAGVVPRIPPGVREQVTEVQVEDDGGLALALASGGTIRLGDAERLRDKFVSVMVVLDQIDVSTLGVLDVRTPERPVLTPRSS